MSDVSAVSTSGGAATPATTTNAAKKASESTKSFEGALKKVSGHSYAKVTSGEHKGEYVNQSGNERDGDTFRIVKRDGAEYHVYGSGDDRTIVRVPLKAAVSTSAAPTTTSLANPG
jgi:hypothetical protein